MSREGDACQYSGAATLIERSIGRSAPRAAFFAGEPCATLTFSSVAPDHGPFMNERDPPREVAGFRGRVKP